ncbi:hypothetical protein ACFWBG_07805 [Nocardia salmonicida]|uniref:hypothetical protein n=1 Tax=Nocardia salmonicida TaxID=53431 RepID=UPI00366DF22D
MAYVVAGKWDRLVWSFRVVADEPVFCEIPGPGIKAPRAWVDAVVAVARDLGCSRYGREVELDGLEWELGIGAEYTVTLGWKATSGIGGFTVGDGMSMDATFCAAAVWAADTAQTELAGYEFVQWPSRGHQLLRPRRIDDTPVWADPRTGNLVCAIGELCRSVKW